jgi:hypothetical protein
MKWTHPVEVMRLRLLGEEPSCGNCYHIQFGQFHSNDRAPEGEYTSDTFCGIRQRDPHPDRAQLEDQVCADWKYPE